jgi:hypothetical protein
MADEKVTTRHNEVVKAVYELCKESGVYEDIYADHIAADQPYVTQVIHSLHTREEPEIMSYRPDVWAKISRTNGIDAYEVWDSQSEEASIADILLAALTADIKTMSVICFDDKSIVRARKLVILSRIHDSKGRLLLEPSNGVLRYVVQAGKDELADYSVLKQSLAKKLDFHIGSLQKVSGTYQKESNCGRGNHDWIRSRGNYLKCTKCGATKTITT